MLLEARKQPVLERMYAAYGRRLLRRAFARVRVGGAAWPTGDGPVIAYANHSAWWDPVLAVFLSHDVFRRDGYGLMDGTQLARYPFFRRVGCFGVVDAPSPGEPEALEGTEPNAAGLSLDDARAVGEYATALLRGAPRRALWLFPQGDLLPSRAPLRFRSGLARIGRSVPDAHLVPIAVRYEFRGEACPECVVRLGPATTGAGVRSTALLTRRLERDLTDHLATLDADLASGADLDTRGYRSVLTGGPTVSQVYERTLGRLGASGRAVRRRAGGGRR